jgi:hypothetical protein
MNDDKIKRVALDDLRLYAEKLATHGDKDTANDAVVFAHLLASLRANAERDLLMAQMAARFDQLEKSFVHECEIHAAAYGALVTEFRALQQQQDELRASQEKIALIVDAGVEKISEVVNKIANLSDSIADVTEP